MVPLKLLYAFTPQKIQGQSISGKVVGELGENERSDGLTYVIFSRVRRFDDVAIDGGMTFARITRKIRDRNSFQRRLESEKNILESRVRSTLILYKQLFEALPFGVELNMQGEDENVPFEVIG